jgi:hypothetical protein
VAPLPQPQIPWEQHPPPLAPPLAPPPPPPPRYPPLRHPPPHYPRNAKITIAMFLANGLEQTVCRQGSAKQRALRAAVCFVKFLFLFGFGCFVVFLNVGTLRTTQRIHLKSAM